MHGFDYGRQNDFGEGLPPPPYGEPIGGPPVPPPAMDNYTLTSLDSES